MGTCRWLSNCCDFQVAPGLQSCPQCIKHDDSCAALRRHHDPETSPIDVAIHITRWGVNSCWSDETTARLEVDISAGSMQTNNLSLDSPSRCFQICFQIHRMCLRMCFRWNLDEAPTSLLQNDYKPMLRSGALLQACQTTSLNAPSVLWLYVCLLDWQIVCMIGDSLGPDRQVSRFERRLAGQR